MAKKVIKKDKKEEPKVITKYDGVLIRPRVTEKGSYLEARNVFAFEISPESNKSEVIKAVKEIYKVTPLKVNIIKNPAKRVSFRGNSSKSGGVKKAYISLKEGDKLNK